MPDRTTKAVRTRTTKASAKGERPSSKSSVSLEAAPSKTAAAQHKSATKTTAAGARSRKVTSPNVGDEQKARRKKAGTKTATSAKQRTQSATRSRKTSRGEQPALLSGGNPQIAKGDGDGPVRAYIAAMPEWKTLVGRRLDELIETAVPGVRK